MSWQIINADARHIPLKDKAVQCVVTDPPYGLGFMGKLWDHGVPGVEFWIEINRVCKPGAFLLAFGGTRTFHRLVCAIEDAGWEIRDQIMWLYGSGFPKSLDVSKAIDKAAGATPVAIGIKQGMNVQRSDGAAVLRDDNWVPSAKWINITAPATQAAKEWQGWGTALKPAFEPIIVARKPIEGTVAENVQKWGAGAMNIDACRIEARDGVPKFTKMGEPAINCYGNGLNGSNRTGEIDTTTGRWPANVILDNEAAAMLDEQSGERKGCQPHIINSQNKNYGWGTITQKHGELVSYADTGGASRFFYTPKADRKDRGDGNTHPTVKPQALIEYLIKLVSRPGDIVLDPFAGSGTTALVADKMGRIGIGLDNDPKSARMAMRRCFDDAPLLAAARTCHIDGDSDKKRATRGAKIFRE